MSSWGDKALGSIPPLWVLGTGSESRFVTFHCFGSIGGMCSSMNTAPRSASFVSYSTTVNSMAVLLSPSWRYTLICPRMLTGPFLAEKSAFVICNAIFLHRVGWQKCFETRSGLALVFTRHGTGCLLYYYFVAVMIRKFRGYLSAGSFAVLSFAFYSLSVPSDFN